MSVNQSNLSPSSNTKKWTIALWVLQFLLAVLYTMSGVMNSFMPPDQLIAMGMSHAKILPLSLVRFIGLMEFLGAIGLILPAALRIFPKHTSYAALGLVLLQILAMIYHILENEFFMLPINFLLLSMAAFVYWGRTYKAAISSK
jgi:putative oxidoreductase